MKVNDWTLKIKDTRRPCYVDDRKGLFHCWSQQATILNSEHTFMGTVGIVEFEDGHVARVLPNNIQFADGGSFGDFVFFPKERLDER